MRSSWPWARMSSRSQNIWAMPYVGIPAERIALPSVPPVSMAGTMGGRAIGSGRSVQRVRVGPRVGVMRGSATGNLHHHFDSGTGGFAKSVLDFGLCYTRQGATVHPGFGGLGKGVVGVSGGEHGSDAGGAGRERFRMGLPRDGPRQRDRVGLGRRRGGRSSGPVLRAAVRAKYSRVTGLSCTGNSRFFTRMRAAASS